MAFDFEKFDKQVDTKKLAEDVKEAEKNGGTGEFPEIPDGVYIVRIENMELGATKDQRPMFKVMFRIVEAVEDADFDRDNAAAMEFMENWKGKKKPCIFMNRVVYGTKNDSGMIASVIGFLSKLESEVSPIAFESYSQFADLILDIAEDVCESLEFEVEYKHDDFNSVSVKEVYEI